MTHPAATAIGGPEGGGVGVLLQEKDKCVLIAAPAAGHTQRVMRLVQVVSSTLAQPAEVGQAKDLEKSGLIGLYTHSAKINATTRLSPYYLQTTVAV